MPDLIHILVVIVGTLHATSPQNVPGNMQIMSTISPKPGSLSVIIRSYKSSVTRQARRIDPEFGWQSRFYDRVIRNRYEYISTKQYIHNNPDNFMK